MLTRESGLCGMYVNGRLIGSLPGFRFDSGRSACLETESLVVGKVQGSA
nr:MAG TPA: hypothetical protein [Caudoviricetes sp.]